MQTLLLYWSLGSILVAGPKADAIGERFCEHKIATINADGKDIFSVKMCLRSAEPEEAFAIE